MKLEKTKVRLINERFDALEQDLFMKSTYAEEKLQTAASDVSKRIRDAFSRISDQHKELEMKNFTRFELCVDKLKTKFDRGIGETAALAQALKSEIAETAESVSNLFATEARTREREEELLIHEIERSISNLQQVYTFS